MKRILAFIGVMFLAGAHADTTINAVNQFSYGANVGWINWRGNVANGAVIGEYVCSGYLYSANVGWINLGNGLPADSVRYRNNSATDFGVNHDGLGNLRGYAYGANIGWISFEDIGAPKVDLLTGKLSGSIYSANCGWISLSNAFAFVRTDSIQQGALSSNGLPTAWLLENFNTTNINANDDADGDGLSNLQEYLAGTDPNDPESNLKITGYGFAPGGSFATLTWNSVPTRLYYVQKTINLGQNLWNDSGLGLIEPNGNSTTAGFADTQAPIHFYRVQAVRPLTP